MNFICFYPDSKTDSVVSIGIEELIFENTKASKEAFRKYQVLKKINLPNPPLAPLNLLIFLKGKKIFVLSSDKFHQFPIIQTKYSDWIVNKLFDGIRPQIIEIHK